jgi:hypothetical protein
MKGASAEYVTITEPSLDAPRLTTMLVHAGAIEPDPPRIAMANTTTNRRRRNMCDLLVGCSANFPGPIQHIAWAVPGEAAVGQLEDSAGIGDPSNSSSARTFCGPPKVGLGELVERECYPPIKVGD